jgi:hypothetical protein
MTLDKLIKDYSGNAYGFQDAGNGSSSSGQLLDYDNDARTEYGEVEMSKLPEAIKLDDGTQVEYASDWIVTGEGSNPYRYRIFF